MTFKDIAGHSDIKKRLIKSARDGRIAHAQLFFGPEGSGNLALALAYAQYINCTQPSEDDSCGICPSCIKNQKLIHPDLHFAFPVATAKNTVKEPVSNDYMPQWRELLLHSPYISPQQWYEKIELENKQGIISKNESLEIIRKLNLKPYESEYKIMIIWLPEKMNISAGNKLLKILEEPPEKTLFLLVPENTEPILRTIISRAQLVIVPKLNNDDISSFLQQKFNLSPQQISDIVQMANGNIGNAISIYENNNEDSFNLDKFISLMRLAWSRDIPGILQWSESLAGTGRERQKIFLLYALRLVRSNYLMNCQVPELSRLTQKESEFSSKFFNFINSENISFINDEINKAYTHIESNANNKIVFVDMALKFIRLLRM